MSADLPFDVETLLKDVASHRPAFLDHAAVNEEHVTWAISELERAGLHPGLGNIGRTLGRGTQRMLRPLVNEFYRRRSTQSSTPAPFSPDEALRDLYGVVAKHVRQELMNEFAEELERIRCAQRVVDDAKADASAKLAMADERLAAMQALSEELRHELEEGRSERTALQVRLENTSANLVQTRQALEDAQARLSEVGSETNRLSSRVDELVREGAELRSAAVAADERARLAEATVAASHAEVAIRREAAAESERQVRAEQGRSKVLSQRVEELSRSNTRFGNQLEQGRSRLARERTVKADLESKIHLAATEMTEMKRRLILLQKQLARAEEHSVQSAAEAKSLRGQLGKLERESRQVRATCLRLERERRRVL